MTSVLILSVWIGIQEYEQNTESEYCAGTVTVHKCVISAGSDYMQHEGTVVQKKSGDIRNWALCVFWTLFL